MTCSPELWDFRATDPDSVPVFACVPDAPAPREWIADHFHAVNDGQPCPHRHFARGRAETCRPK
jgi:hypothetical protein